MNARYFVTGIGTGVGKTVVSSIFVRALGADYWKPVQAGSLDRTDTDVVRDWARSEGSVFHPEAYRLREALSPHAAAAREGQTITPAGLRSPETSRPLVIEGAGGFLVPLSDRFLVADLAVSLEAPVILVSRHYLGSINHTLLTLEAIHLRRLTLAGIVFVGDENAETESAILSRAGVPLLFRVPETEAITPEFVATQAALLKERLGDGILG